MCPPETYLTAQPLPFVYCSVGIFVTGIVYGLQPDALFVIIPALTLPTKLAAAAYTLMFVFGTCAAMGGYTAVIGRSCLPQLKVHFCRIDVGCSCACHALRLSCARLVFCWTTHADACRHVLVHRLDLDASCSLCVHHTVVLPHLFCLPAASASRQLPKSMNSRLASISSSIAVVVGLLVLASGFGVPLPFSLSLAP